MRPPPDTPADALDEVAKAAEQSAEEQQEVARRARELSARSRRGASWTELANAGTLVTVVTALRACARDVLSAARNLQAALVHGLAREGHTTRQIAERIGVSHQHVSAFRRRTQPGAELPSE